MPYVTAYCLNQGTFIADPAQTDSKTMKHQAGQRKFRTSYPPITREMSATSSTLPSLQQFQLLDLRFAHAPTTVIQTVRSRRRRFLCRLPPAPFRGAPHRHHYSDGLPRPASWHLSRIRVRIVLAARWIGQLSLASGRRMLTLGLASYRVSLLSI